MASHHSNNGLSFVVKRYLHETTLKVLMRRFDTPHTLAFLLRGNFDVNNAVVAVVLNGMM